MPDTVLISTPAHLGLFKEHDEFADAQVFTDVDALRALDVITRHRPPVVVLDSAFAATSRGAALVNRIKADPSLETCEIRVIEVAQEEPHGSTRHGAAATLSASSIAVAEFGAPVATSDIADPSGTRREARVTFADEIEVLIDGNPATLVDLSSVGATVLSPTIVRPNQRVRLSIPDPARPIRFNAGVTWAIFELLKIGPRYRAGIEFFDADAAAIQRFIDASRKT